MVKHLLPPTDYDLREEEVRRHPASAPVTSAASNYRLPPTSQLADSIQRGSPQVPTRALALGLSSRPARNWCSKGVAHKYRRCGRRQYSAHRRSAAMCLPPTRVYWRRSPGPLARLDRTQSATTREGSAGSCLVSLSAGAAATYLTSSRVPYAKTDKACLAPCGTVDPQGETKRRIFDAEMNASSAARADARASLRCASTKAT